ncbi:MAG: RNA-binding S4 domain-containing protein [Bacteroidales bacterium]
MQSAENIRIDKFLWSVRLFKSRRLASEACKKGKIMVNNTQAKSSRTVAVKDIITVRRPPITFTYEVKELINNRISAKMVHKYIEDLTPEEERIKLLAISRPVHGIRSKGAGRPTKKERREIDNLFDSDSYL